MTDQTPPKDDTKTIDDVADELSSKDQSLVDDKELSTDDFDVTTLGEAYVKDGKPNFEAIAAALARSHADVPGEDEAYDLDFGEDFDLKDEEGKPVKLDPEDPLVKDFESIAREHGIGKGAAKALMGLYGKVIKSAVQVDESVEKARQENEYKKLGETPEKGKERALAAAKGLDASFGPKVRPLIAALTSASLIEAAEAILEGVNGEGSTSPTDDPATEEKSAAEILYGKK